jgi:acetyl esterase/lipase
VSIVARILNLYLRLTEKPYLAREQDPWRIRAGFERKARIFFRAPSGAQVAEGTLNGIPALTVTARDVDPEARPMLFYLHGGAYVFGSPKTHKAMLARLSVFTGLPAVLPGYRKAPEHVFPAALEDTERAYRAAVAKGPVIIGGDSAGGGLALALLGRILAEGWPQPLGVFAFSPLTDLTFSGASVTRNARAEAILPVARIDELRNLYLAGADPTDPRASPLFADFKGAPPVWLCVGDTEILLDDTRRIAAQLRAAGADVTEIVERDLPHVWPIFQTLLPEARHTLRDLAGWIGRL